VAALAVGDFNNDGSIDMAVVRAGSNTISVLLQSPSMVTFERQRKFRQRGWWAAAATRQSR
jgi:hypothetical protein